MVSHQPLLELPQAELAQLQRASSLTQARCQRRKDRQVDQNAVADWIVDGGEGYSSVNLACHNELADLIVTD